MTPPMSVSLSRRGFLGATGLVVAFSIAGRAFAQQSGGGEGGPGPAVLAPNLPGSLKNHPFLDSWIQIENGQPITVFTGKVELGQGIKTALIQVAAEELDVEPATVHLVTADTYRTPDEGLTAGSHSMQDSGTAIRNAAANVRMLLCAAAAENWGVYADNVTTTGTGSLRGSGGREISYGEIAATMSLHVAAIPNAPLRKPSVFRSIGKELPRIDIPAKVTGGAAYIHDMRLPGMLHARVVRGPSVGTRLDKADIDAVAAMPGIIKVVQNGDFMAVVAEKEWTAIRAMRELQAGAFRRVAKPLPNKGVVETLKALPTQEIVILDTNTPVAPAVKTVSARYTRPWISHGSIGPSCALAHFADGVMTVWTHSQGTFDVHRVVAELIGLPPEKVHAIHVEGAGCYGQNGADDVSADVAVIAREVPGKPIRLQWMREQEFGWEPLGPAMVTELQASLDASNVIVDWRHEVWSNPHNNRPVGAGGVLAGSEVTPGFHPDAGRGWQSEFQSALCAAQYACALSLPERHADPCLRSAVIGRPSERLLD